jgi:hypothetical protein
MDLMDLKRDFMESVIDRQKAKYAAHKKLILLAIVCTLAMGNSVHLAEIQDKLHRRARKNRSLLMRKQH